MELFARYALKPIIFVLTNFFQNCFLDARLHQPDVRFPLGNEDDLVQISVTGRSRVPLDGEYARLAQVIQNDDLHHGRRANQNMNHNAVDVPRIQSGMDVRTTVSTFPPCSCSLLTLTLSTDHASQHPESR